MSLFGIIALGGMVVNNAIVLVEFTNQRRREGLSIREAILDAARIRLKPILITTLTTILGLIPLAFALGEGSEIYAPLGQVIGGGLLTSTLITLGLVPVLYELTEKGRNFLKELERKRREYIERIKKDLVALAMALNDPDMEKLVSYLPLREKVGREGIILLVRFLELLVECREKGLATERRTCLNFYRSATRTLSLP